MSGGSAEGEGPVMAEAAGENPQPVRRSIRRRLVQSTLFPHKPAETETNSEKKGDKEENGGKEEEEGEDEDCCGSQGKKKRARKGKATPTPPTKAPKKGKSPAQSTPRKNGITSGKTSADLVVEKEDSPPPPPIPNLRLEAKMKAQEYSQMFTWKQVHPFFSSWKGSKRSHETAEVENGCCLVQRKDRDSTIGPIHVFENDQDDSMTLDWGKWEFVEKSVSDIDCSLRGHSFTSVCQDDMLLVECPSQKPATISAMSSEGQVASCQLADVAEPICLDCEDDDVGSCSGCARKSKESDFLQERTRYDCLGDQVEGSLWIDKYQPQKAAEVCGNNESVRFLSEWLHAWYQGSQQDIKVPSVGHNCDTEDADYNFFQSDSDSEHTNGGTAHKNVLLVTGPVGSGKTAAIYACAKEQGFKVLEANASDCRNGVVVKQRFGEAFESHSLEWSQENSVGSQRKCLKKLSTAPFTGKSTQESNSEVIKVMTILDEDKSHGAAETTEDLVGKESSDVCGQALLKPLILFEDVDITFPEDRGFIAAIQQIAEKAKGPVILTSNSDDPVLPHNLDRLAVCFTVPSEEELLQHVNTVCSAEKANIQPNLIKQFMECCGGDIRKTIMHLQFWCQGRGAERNYSRLTFDPEVVHQMLPKLIPWDFPSQLSELVEKEITKSISLKEEDSVVLDVNEDKFGNKMRLNGLEVNINGSIEAKKRALLSRNCSNQNCLFDEECDFLNSSPPVSLFQRKGRRKLVVMSSDSEDDPKKSSLVISEANNGFLEDNDEIPTCDPNMQNCSSPQADVQSCSEAEKLMENHCQFSEAVNGFHVQETCKSVDTSCVPESSFVPETEMNIEAEVSSSQVADTFEVSMTHNFDLNLLPPVETVRIDESVPRLHKNDNLLRNTCHAITALPHEQVDDSQNEHSEAVLREYQLMDECSCMEFNKKFKPTEKFRSSRTHLVQEAWRKLRDRRTDLRQFFDLEDKDASGIIAISFAMTDLISDAELLLSKCQPLGWLELPMVHPDVLDLLSWCDKQLQMTSTFAQHGFCFHVKGVASFGSKMRSDVGVYSTWEILSECSTNEFVGFLKQLMSGRNASPVGMSSTMSLRECETSFKREMKPSLFNVIQSIVPLRSYGTMKGDAFHEYLSCLGHIARSEACRLPEGNGNTKRRRGRPARSYLSGSLMLSPEEISMLVENPLILRPIVEWMPSFSWRHVADERIVGLSAINYLHQRTWPNVTSTVYEERRAGRGNCFDLM